MAQDATTADESTYEAELEELRQRIVALQDDVGRIDKRFREALHHRPFVAIGGAILVGFLLGRVVGRS